MVFGGCAPFFISSVVKIYRQVCKKKIFIFFCFFAFTAILAAKTYTFRFYPKVKILVLESTGSLFTYFQITFSHYEDKLAMQPLLHGGGGTAGKDYRYPEAKIQA